MRRWIVLALVVAVSGCGWTQARFDAAHTANNAGERTIGTANVAALVPSWWAGAGTNAFYVDPLVFRGRVVSSSGHDVRAFNAATGAPLWTAGSLGGGTNVVTLVSATAVGTVPGTSGDAVFVGELDFPTPLGGGGTWGYLSARDLASGALVWSSPVGGVISQAVLDSGTLFVMVNHHNGDGHDFAGMVAVDAGTGTVDFRVPFGGGSIAVANGVIYLAGLDGVSAVPSAGCGAASCTPLWTGRWPTGSGSTVAVSAGRLFLASVEGLAVFDAGGCGSTSCAPLWTAPTNAGAGIAVAGGSVFVTADRLSGTTGPVPMQVFAASGCGQPTCSALWSTTEAGRFGPPSVANGVVYATGHAGPTQAWPAVGCGLPTCAALWSSGVPLDGTVAPLVADGRLYIGAGEISTYVVPN